MTSALEKLVEETRKIQMSEPEKTAQRISFAFGTANIENENVTREIVIEAAKVVGAEANS